MSQSKISIEEEKESSNSTDNSDFITVVLTTFTTVFLAELGDKTQIATLILSAQSGRPIIVFVGAASALVCSSLVGVLIGRWLAKSMPPERFEYMAGFLMLSIGLWLGIQAMPQFIHVMSQQ